VKPKIQLNLGVAAILDRAGYLRRFLPERLDDTLKGAGDVERLLGLATVGLIPVVPQLNGNHRGAHRLLENTKALTTMKWERPEGGRGMASN